MTNKFISILIRWLSIGVLIFAIEFDDIFLMLFSLIAYISSHFIEIKKEKK